MDSCVALFTVQAIGTVSGETYILLPSHMDVD